MYFIKDMPLVLKTFDFCSMVGFSFHLLLVGVQNCIHDGYRCTGTG